MYLTKGNCTFNDIIIAFTVLSFFLFIYLLYKNSHGGEQKSITIYVPYYYTQ